MYKKIIRPIFFRINPETIHELLIVGMKILRYLPFGKKITASVLQVKDEALEREVMGLKFPNPIGMAAGFDKNAEVYDVLNSMGFGFVEIGTVTPKGQPGNSKPRLFRLPKDKALINRMGFNNKGVEEVIKRLRHKNPKLIVGGNIGKNTATPNEKSAEDYLSVFRMLYDYVDYFVVNVSCPNVVNLTSLQNKCSTMEIINSLIEFRRGQTVYRPILLKISPDLTDKQVDDMIDVVRESRIDGIVATNTTTHRDNLFSSVKKINKAGRGGLSGGPLTNRSIEMVRYINKKTDGKMVIIGVGGIMTTEDALAMLEAGADLIQLYTGYIYEGPFFPKRICRELLD